MKTFAELVNDRLLRNGIPERTAASEKMLEEIANWRDKFRAGMFGIDYTAREILFFEQSNATYNHESSQFKGNIVKSPMANAVADSVAYDFYNTPTGSNGFSVVKDSPNADTESSIGQIARLNEIMQNCESVISDVSNIIYSGAVFFYAVVSVSADVITFSQSQLLEVGDTVTISNVEYTVLSETQVGLVYQVDGSPTAGIASYEFEFTQNRWPLISPINCIQYPRY